MATVVTFEGKRKTPSLEPLLSLCADDMAQVDREILARMRSPVALIPELANHLVGAGGKRMRPLLTVAAARLCGYTATDDRHIKLATCVEFIHSATLLHDDVVDVSALRRGKPSANAVWGDKASVLVGDFLFTRSFELMVDVGSLDILGVLSRASSTIAEGEVLQLVSQRDTSLRPRRPISRSSRPRPPSCSPRPPKSAPWWPVATGPSGWRSKASA